jgi:hypothetical protein
MSAKVLLDSNNNPTREEVSAVIRKRRLSAICRYRVA